MTFKFILRNIFKLPEGLIVLACEGDEAGFSTPAGLSGRIEQYGELRQSIRLSSERRTLNQCRLKLVQALETFEDIRLTVEEAESGTWTLSVD